VQVSTPPQLARLVALRPVTLRVALRRVVHLLASTMLTRTLRLRRSEDDTIGDLKKLVAAQTGTRPEKIRIQKW
jgi:hypothetical protein